MGAASNSYLVSAIPVCGYSQTSVMTPGGGKGHSHTCQSNAAPPPPPVIPRWIEGGGLVCQAGSNQFLSKLVAWRPSENSTPNRKTVSGSESLVGSILRRISSRKPVGSSRTNSLRVLSIKKISTPSE